MSDLEDLRRAANGDNSRRALAELMLESKGDPVGAILELLAAAAPVGVSSDVVAYCVVSLDAEHDAPCANSAIGDYLEFECDAPYIDQENWPKEVLLVCLNKAGQVVETQTVNVLEFVQDSYPQWLGEVDE